MQDAIKTINRKLFNAILIIKFTITNKFIKYYSLIYEAYIELGG